MNLSLNEETIDFNRILSGLFKPQTSTHNIESSYHANHKHNLLNY